MAELALAIAAPGRVDPARFWQALGGEGYGDGSRVEVHLAHDDDSALVGKPDWVHAHRLDRASVFRLWGHAIAQSAAPHVAILSIHQPPAPGWLAAMLDAIRTGETACFGPVEENYPARDRGIVGYLVEYGQFHRPISPRLQEIPGSNLVIERQAIGASAGDATSEFNKTLLLRKWRAAGYWPKRIDDAVVIHCRPFSSRHFRLRRFDHGRAFAAQRMTMPGAPRRLLALAFTPLLPLLRVARIWARTRHVARLRRSARRHFFMILAAETAWSAGEFAGYAWGAAEPPPVLD